MATLVNGIGLVGTSFAQEALKRGERLVFFDFQPRLEFLKRKLGEAKVDVIQKDIRDLPALVQAMKDHNVDTVVHTAGGGGGGGGGRRPPAAPPPPPPTPQLYNHNT